jgi:hypothetical protein
MLATGAPNAHAHRFGRKIKLPSTIAIKHQIRMRMAQERMAQDEVERVEAEARNEVLCGRSSEELLVK